MAALGGSADNELVVKEGFLCPICLRDLGDIVQLQVHVTEGHAAPSAASEAADLALHHMKDFLGRAKQRILKFESTLTSISPVVQIRGDEEQQSASQASISVATGARSGYMDESPPSPQTMGPTTSHTAYLKRIRDASVDQCAVETNKLIIRLDKLVTDAPSDPSKRKGIQQESKRWPAALILPPLESCLPR